MQLTTQPQNIWKEGFNILLLESDRQKISKDVE